MRRAGRLLVLLAMLAPIPAAAQFVPLTPISPGASHDTVPLTPLDPAAAPKVPLGEMVPQTGPSLVRAGTLVCPSAAGAAAGSLLTASCTFNMALPGAVLGYSLVISLSPNVPSSVNSGAFVWSVMLPAGISPASSIAGDYDGGGGALGGGPGRTVTLVPFDIPGTSDNLARYVTALRIAGS